MTIIQLIRARRWFDAALVLMAAVALALAGVNHARDLIEHGLFPYSRMSGAPGWLNLYWSGLTLLDLVAALALLVRVRLGVLIALCIMITNVPINLLAIGNDWAPPRVDAAGVIKQGLFLAFLIVLLVRVRRGGVDA